MLEFLNNIMVWIVAFFASAILNILLLVVFFIIRFKTHALIELRALVKKTPISLFFSDGKLFDMKANPIEANTTTDKDYGLFTRHEGNSYISKRTGKIVDVYDTGFTPGLNINAAETVSYLKEMGESDSDIQKLMTSLANGELSENTEINAIRKNINLNHLKQYENYVEPHNQEALIEKKLAKKLRSAGVQNGMSVALIFIAIFGAIVMGAILLNIMG